MKRHISLLLVLLVNTVTVVQAMNGAHIVASKPASLGLKGSLKGLVKLPSAEILLERLQGLGGLDHFIQKTGIHTVLGDRNLHPTGVDADIKIAIADYTEEYTSTITASFLYMMQPKIIRAMLVGHVAAIQLLEEHGFLVKEKDAVQTNKEQMAAAEEKEIVEEAPKAAEAATIDDAWGEEVTVVWH